MSLVWTHSCRGPWLGPGLTKALDYSLRGPRFTPGPTEDMIQASKLTSQISTLILILKSFLKKIIYFHIPIPVPFSSSSSIPPLLPTSHSLLREVKASPRKSTRSVLLPFWGRTKSLPMPMLSKVSLHRQWAPQRQFMHRVRSWSHYQWPHSTPLPIVF